MAGFPYDTDPALTGQYDDAWQTEGWTAQQGDFPDYEDGFVPPQGIHKVKITGLFSTSEGRRMSGVLTFIPESRLEVVGGQQVIFDTHKEYKSRGVLDVDLTMPLDRPFFTYKVRQRVGPVNRQYDLVLDPTMTEYDIVNAVSATSSDPVIYPEGFPILADLTIVQGATWSKTYRWTQGTSAKDLSTWTAKMQIRAADGTLIEELTTENGGVTLTASGDISLHLSASETSAMSSGGAYDLELYGPNGDVIRFLEGTVTLSPEVTI